MQLGLFEGGTSAAGGAVGLESPGVAAHVASAAGRAEGAPAEPAGRKTRSEGPVARTPVRLAVLASSSSGNCSVLLSGEGRNVRAVLIDAGLSPLRTRKLLSSLGVGIERVDAILFTHLDADHAKPGWIRGLPRHACFRIHRRHLGRARRAGFLTRRTEVFDGAPFGLAPGVRAAACLADHDSLGVAAFRIDVRTPGADEPASLGYATDLGRPTGAIVDHLRGVDVLAIESNYCPELQEASDRPAFLKSRIMDGSGHLSNAECVRAVRAIGPRRDVVLLHLSRECNTPERARAPHAGAAYGLTVAPAEGPTRWVGVAGV